jgi:hypothetical protein
MLVQNIPVGSARNWKAVIEVDLRPGNAEYLAVNHENVN